jgi:hypothetical protein
MILTCARRSGECVGIAVRRCEKNSYRNPMLPARPRAHRAPLIIHQGGGGQPSLGYPEWINSLWRNGLRPETADYFVSRIGDAATNRFVNADWIDAVSDAMVKYLPAHFFSAIGMSSTRVAPPKLPGWPSVAL